METNKHSAIYYYYYFLALNVLNKSSSNILDIRKIQRSWAFTYYI